MKIVLVVACWLLVASGGFAQEWVPFTSPKGSFKAEFPSTPVETQSTPNELGSVPYTTYLAETQGGNVAYGVVFNDYPDEILKTDPQKVLDGGRDGLKDNLQGAIVNDTPLTFRGYPAREVTILGEIQGRKLFYHTRVILIGRRMYQLHVVRVGETPVDIADVVRFFASFDPAITPADP